MKQTRPLATIWWWWSAVLEFLHIIVELTEILTLKIVVPTMKYERVDNETIQKKMRKSILCMQIRLCVVFKEIK